MTKAKGHHDRRMVKDAFVEWKFAWELAGMGEVTIIPGAPDHRSVNSKGKGKKAGPVKGKSKGNSFGTEWRSRERH